MSANAFQHELIVLIFRHLKDNGFRSAAEELLRHSPQELVVGPASISSSLGEIYDFWLKHSKNKYSNSKKGGSTQIKAAPKKDIPAKKVLKRKLAIPKKEEKDVKSSETVTPAKMLKKDQNAVASGAGDSDSDSSLDVDKWKNMLLQMTELDVAKMNTLNALDSTTPKPVKRAARQTRAKPKTDLLLKQTAEIKSNILGKAVAVEHAKSSPSKKTSSGTETALPDVAKMDTLNALDSTTPKPVKRGARQTRAKPKTDLLLKQTAEIKSNILGKAVTVEDAKSSPSKKTSSGTETALPDLAKMDTLNALDSTTPKPVKRRARQTQAKPKTDLLLKQTAEIKSNILGKAVTVEDAKSSPSKKTSSGTETASKPPLVTLNGTHLLPSDDGRTATSSSKRREKKEKAEAPTLQRKKEKKQSSENDVGANTKENVSEEQETETAEYVEKPVENITNCSTKFQDERAAMDTSGNAEQVNKKEKKAKKKKEAADNQTISETHGKDKKSKKKKETKDCDQESLSEPVNTVDSVKGGEEMSQQENADKIDDNKEARRIPETPSCMFTPSTDVGGKKAKDKKRASHPAEGTPQQVSSETKGKRKKDKANIDEEQIVEDKNTSVLVEEGAEPNTDVKKKRKIKLGSVDTVPLFPLETPSPASTKKKRKSKVDSVELPATPTSA
ncbi:DNA ligase 1 [Syngnathus acus]|uniref:DNA ligase 1 n=1 Tax=Syngnathus acus TaxID=161584 RepID=UPI001885C83F|nr:DNA ligase 1 [Syngnathus acus]